MDDDRALADDTPETEWVCQMAHLLADRLRLDPPSIRGDGQGAQESPGPPTTPP